MNHVLKIAPEYFEAIISDQKKFELRQEDDRYFSVGDSLCLEEWNGSYTGRYCMVLVNYLLRDFPGLQPGWVILSFNRSFDRSSRF